MRRFLFTRNFVVLKPSRRSIGAHHTQDAELGKNILFGGPMQEHPDRRSLGRFFYERLKDPSRANKIIQVCAATGQSMTTRTFLQQSVAVAEGLREKNIRKGDFILVVGNNSLNMNVALAGIILLGAVAVPISYFANPDDLRHLITFIKPKFFICDGQTLFTIRRIVSSVLGQIDEKKIFLLNDCKYLNTDLQCFPDFVKGRDADWESFKPVEVKNPKEELALVMKSLAEGAADRGVGLTHFNLLSVVARYEFTRGDQLASEVILMVQKIIWMSGIHSLMLACCCGSTLVVMSEFDEEEFMKCVQRHKVTTCYLYPAKLWQLYKYQYPETYDVSSCKKMYAVGTGIPRLLIKLMEERIGIRIKPAYGMTEMSGIIIEPRADFKEDSMGQLVPACYAKVVSVGSNQKYGANKAGELCFKGSGLMKGYINDEKATRNIIDKEGFLHTGDYGYYDEEGNFFILDKLKEVIRYRDKEVWENEISPMEIEGVVKSIDAVKDCVVGGISHPKDGYRAVAFVVLQPGKTATAEEIKKYVENKLPEHKHLKGGVVFIPKVPRSRESGFIKRAAINKVLSKYRLMTEAEEMQKAAAEVLAQQRPMQPSGRDPAAPAPTDANKSK